MLAWSDNVTKTVFFAEKFHKPLPNSRGNQLNRVACISTKFEMKMSDTYGDATGGWGLNREWRTGQNQGLARSKKG